MSDERECDICGRGTDAFICWDCAGDVQRKLTDTVPGLADDLEITITRGAKFSRSTARLHGDVETAVPFHEGASEAKQVLHNVLTSWIRIVCESRGVDLPKGA